MGDLRHSREQCHDDGVNAWRVVRTGPPPELAGEVFGYSDYRERTGGFTTRRELPHAEGVLIFNLDGPITITAGDGGTLTLKGGEAFFAGAHLRPALSQSGGAQAGIHVFLPLITLQRLLGTPMHEFVDRVVPVDLFLGREGRELGSALVESRDDKARVQLLDRMLRRRLMSVGPLDQQRAHALRLLRLQAKTDISDIARELGWSRKHLADRVRDMVGVGPRCFRRLLRFQALVATIGDGAPDGDWAALAHDAGYCDQSHMIREFREFSELTPTAFLTRSLPAGGGLIEA